MRLTVFGTGCLGANHVVCMAELGHELLGVDIDEDKIKRLRAGEVSFYEPGLPEILWQHVESGRLRFTTDYAEAPEFADLHFIGVGAPQRKGEFAAGMSHDGGVVARLPPLVARDSVPVGKFMVALVTVARLQGFADSYVPSGVHTKVVWNPEFLREGLALNDTLPSDSIVIGKPGWSEEQSRDRELVEEAFAPNPVSDSCAVIVTGLAASELVKVSAKAFLTTKISFTNAVSEIYEDAAADLTVPAEATRMDPQIGRKCLSAELGCSGRRRPRQNPARREKLYALN